MKTSPWRDRVALVTGAGTGLGLVTTRILLAAGLRVVGHYRTHRPEFPADRFRAVQADFSQPEAYRRLFDEAWSWHQRLDILVNNAALIERVGWPELDEERFNQTLAVNATAPLLLSHLAVEAMAREGWGRIVSVSSIGIKFNGSPQTGHYMVSKAALEAGTLALAKLAAPRGVLVNVVRAGVMDTQVQERLGRQMTDREKLIPLERAAHPQEVAQAIAFLVSEQNTYTTGAVLPVAGGE